MSTIMQIFNRCFLYAICFVLTFGLEGKKKQVVVFIDPIQECYYRDQLFELNKPLWGRARQRFAQEGILLTTDRRYLNPSLDCYVLFNAPCSSHALKMMQCKKTKKILMAWEPPAVTPQNYSPRLWQQFDQVMTFNDDVKKARGFKRLNYCFNLAQPSRYIPFFDKKLCTLIAANKRSASAQDSIYSLREKIITYFINRAPEDFDLWGFGWPKSAVYHGIVEDKLGCMSQYKFAFCLENSCIPGYITEKIFDAFSAGCVPIYLGAPNIYNYIPKSCFIDYRDFSSLDELYSYLKSMPDTEYENYLIAARQFLQSPSALAFSYPAFIEQLLKTVKEVLSQ